MKIQFGAYFNVDFERKSKILDNGTTTYFFPHKETGCYSSIVNQSNLNGLNEYGDRMHAYIA